MTQDEKHPQNTSTNEKAELANKPINAAAEENTLPSYEEAVSFQTFSNNLGPTNDENAANSSFYVQSNTSFASNTSYLQGQPSRPVSEKSGSISNQPVLGPNGSYVQEHGAAAPNTSYMAGQPSQPGPVNYYAATTQPVTTTPINTGVNIYPSAPAPLSPSSIPVVTPYVSTVQANNSTAQQQQAYQSSTYQQYPPQPYPQQYPPQQYPPQPYPQQYQPQQYPPQQYPPQQQKPFVKHRFNPKESESKTNFNFEVCNDGEYQDMIEAKVINTGTFGNKKTVVNALSRDNYVKSSIGMSVIDIRGARILHGETKITFDGTLGKIILVVPKHCALTIDDQYCIGEIFSYRPSEIPINEAMQQNIPIIRLLVKNTVGDVNIIEKDAKANVNSSETLNHEIKKIRKDFSKQKLNKPNTIQTNGASLISMKTMLMKSFNSAKQSLGTGTSNGHQYPGNAYPGYPKPGQPQPGQPQPGQPQPYGYPYGTPGYGAPAPGAPNVHASPYGVPAYNYGTPVPYGAPYGAPYGTPAQPGQTQPEKTPGKQDSVKNDEKKQTPGQQPPAAPQGSVSYPGQQPSAAPQGSVSYPGQQPPPAQQNSVPAPGQPMAYPYGYPVYPQGQYPVVTTVGYVPTAYAPVSAPASAVPMSTVTTSGSVSSQVSSSAPVTPNTVPPTTNAPYPPPSSQATMTTTTTTSTTTTTAPYPQKS